VARGRKGKNQTPGQRKRTVPFFKNRPAFSVVGWGGGGRRPEVEEKKSSVLYPSKKLRGKKKLARFSREGSLRRRVGSFFLAKRT